MATTIHFQMNLPPDSTPKTSPSPVHSTYCWTDSNIQAPYWAVTLLCRALVPAASPQRPPSPEKCLSDKFLGWSLETTWLPSGVASASVTILGLNDTEKRVFLL